MRTNSEPSFRLLAAVLWWLVASGSSGGLLFGRAPDRIHEPLTGDRTFTFPGNRHPLAVARLDQGEAEPSFEIQNIAIRFKMTASQQAQLTALLHRQLDHSSSDYHKWLTPEQYGARFGIGESDAAKVVAWLEGQGFSNVEINRSRTEVHMSGAASIVQAAFRTAIHRYQVSGALHYANAGDPILPKALEGMVLGIRGLHDFRPKPHGMISRVSGRPRFTSSISGNHFITPNDFATIYDLKPLYSSGINGAGQTIAIVGQSDIQVSDIQAFRAAAGLPASDPQIVLDPSSKDPGTQSGDESESDLDIEWAGGLAPQATIIYVNSDNAFGSAGYAIDQNLAPVLSMSYGICEGDLQQSDVDSIEGAFQQANVQGITVLGAAGDTGAADCDSPTDPSATPPTIATHGLSVDYPASSAFVTGIGGTAFDEGTGTYWNATNDSGGGSAISYIPEVAWNDTTAHQPLAAGGGGVSAKVAKPTWQVGLNVPADQWRHVPDVSLDVSPSHDPYLICSAGSCVNGFRNTDSTLNAVGGTSVSAPAFAGLVALMNQQTGSSQGNINGTLYSLASVSSDVFHDITSGNNQVPCQAGTPDCPSGGVLGYVAGAGYDQVTGLGSVDAYNLVREWSSEFQITAAPSTLTVGRGATGSVTVTITPVGNFNGGVHFSCSVSTLTNTTCSIPGTVTKSGTATLTITAAASSVIGAWPHFRQPTLLFLLGAGLVILAASLLHSKQQKQIWWSATALSLLFLTACGDGGSTTESIQQTGTVTITATSGVVNHNATVSVTVP
jgi:subtilase family serine protease